MGKYDYIIIGAGSAGCVLANRLSKNPANEVLLIEAGGPDSKMEIGIPAGYGNLHRSKVDWGFSTEPQKHVNNRKLYLPRGKTLGEKMIDHCLHYAKEQTMITGRSWEIKAGHIKMFFLILKSLNTMKILIIFTMEKAAC